MVSAAGPGVHGRCVGGPQTFEVENRYKRYRRITTADCRWAIRYSDRNMRCRIRNGCVGVMVGRAARCYWRCELVLESERKIHLQNVVVRDRIYLRDVLVTTSCAKLVVDAAGIAVPQRSYYIVRQTISQSYINTL
jgi:hypothetical protein